MIHAREGSAASCANTCGRTASSPRTHILPTIIDRALEQRASDGIGDHRLAARLPHQRIRGIGCTANIGRSPAASAGRVTARSRRPRPMEWMSFNAMSFLLRELTGGSAPGPGPPKSYWQPRARSKGESRLIATDPRNFRLVSRRFAPIAPGALSAAGTPPAAPLPQRQGRRSPPPALRRLAAAGPASVCRPAGAAFRHGLAPGDRTPAPPAPV